MRIDLTGPPRKPVKKTIATEVVGPIRRADAREEKQSRSAKKTEKTEQRVIPASPC